MPPTTQVVVAKRHIVLVAAAAFGGMITAMLATLAITIPVMSAQANSLLDEQAQQYAQLMGAQAQTGKANQAAAFDFVPSEPCVEPEAEQGGKGAGPTPSAGPTKPSQGPAAALTVEHKPMKERPVVPKAKPVHKAPAPAPAPVKHVTERQVVEKKVVNNTYNDNDTLTTINNLTKVTNNVDVETKGKNNTVTVGTSASADSKVKQDVKTEQTEVKVKPQDSKAKPDHKANDHDSKPQKQHDNDKQSEHEQSKDSKHSAKGSMHGNDQ